MSDTVTVKSKFGQLGVIDKKELGDALGRGFSLASNDEIQAHNDHEEYGTGVVNPLTAFAESAADTATFGLSREAENLTGLTTPEAQKARAEQNPMASFAGVPAGIVADPLGAIGLLGKGAKAVSAAAKVGKEASLATKILAKPAAAALGSAVEGAAFGLGQSVSEHALGDPDLNAEKVAANLGYGALIGGGLGGALEFGANRFGASTLKDATKVASFQDDIAAGFNQKAALEAEQAAAPALNPLNPEAPSLVDSAPFKDFPKSLEEIQNAVKTNFPVVPEGLPSSQALKDAVTGLPDLQFKPHNLQLESLTDQHLRDYYKTFLEGGGEEAQALRQYEALQKAEAKAKLDQTISELANGQKVNADPVSAGESAVEAFTKQYDAEKKDLAPLFKKFDKIAEQKSVSAMDAVLRLRDTFPTIGDYINADADGVFKLAKYSPEMPFSKNTYGAIQDVVKAANKPHLSLSEFRNVREAMRDRLTFGKASDRDFAHIGAIRKGMMDEMQEHVAKLAPDLDVRETFKRFAQNEEKRSIIEKILGGSVSDRASFAKQIKPEDVLNKIFSSTLSVDAAKEILGKDFGKVLADHLASNVSRVTDQAKNGFSSNKFASFLRDKTPELKTALAENADKFERLNHLTDYMRILPDSPSVNPSGTAKTLNILQKVSFLQRALDPKNAIKDFAQKFADKAAATQQRYTIDEVLAGKTLGGAEKAAEEKYVAASKLAKIERWAQQASENIKENAKAIFKIGVTTAKERGAKVGESLLSPENKKVANNSEDDYAQIIELQNNPEAMMNKLQASTNALSEHAPGIAQGLQITQVRANEFLASKIPVLPPSSAFSGKPKVPKGELLKFERYMHAIEKPIQVMKHIKSASLAPESVEAIQTVYPKLYQEMSQALLTEAQDLIAKNKQAQLPFKTKMALSLFLGADLDQSLAQGSIMANQLVHLIPSVQAPQSMGGGRSTLGGLKALDQSVAMLTPAQKSAQRLS